MVFHPSLWKTTALTDILYHSDNRNWISPDRTKNYFIVRHGGALVESKPFDRRVVGSNPALAATAPRRDLGQVLNSQLPGAIWRETPAQNPCYVGSASE